MSKFHPLQIIDYSLYKSAVGENTNLGVLAIGRPTTAETTAWRYSWLEPKPNSDPKVENILAAPSYCQAAY
jgi:hypothetical protein